LFWQILGLALGYAVHVALARWMGATQYGSYMYVLAWVALLATPASLGLPLAVVRFVPEYRVQQAWSAMRGLVQGGGLVILGVGAIVAGLAVLALHGFGLSTLDLYFYPLLIGCWLIPLHALIGFGGGVFRGLHQVGWQYAIAPVRHGLLLGVVLLVVWWDRPVTSALVLVASIGIALLVLIGLGMALVTRLPNTVWQSPAVYPGRQWLGVSLPLMLVADFN
jgi:O-antigen/teichoic acid export membrane protein